MSFILALTVTVLAVGFLIWHKKVVREVRQTAYAKGRDAGWVDKAIEDMREAHAKERSRHARNGQFKTPERHM